MGSEGDTVFSSSPFGDMDGAPARYLAGVDLDDTPQADLSFGENLKILMRSWSRPTFYTKMTRPPGSYVRLVPEQKFDRGASRAHQSGQLGSTST